MPERKPIMRCLGEFVGHITRAIKSDPTRESHVVGTRVREDDKGNLTFRRTTIDEIEFKQSPDAARSPGQPDQEGADR
ncbi:MAG: hypothetical protein CMJ32_08360 [Phycisphaerae bacterium]|nr:hypothetical protein [Phycisphaerae bacterium]